MDNFKDYFGLRIFENGTVLEDTASGFVQKSHKKIYAKRVLEAWKGTPRKHKHRNVWFVDGDRSNLAVSNLCWGEIPQSQETQFLRAVISEGFVQAREQFGISSEFAMFVVAGKVMTYEDQLKAITKWNIKWN